MVQSSRCVGRHAALIRLDAGPAPRGDAWVEAVNSPMFETEVARVRESIRRDRLLGDKIWTLATAKELHCNTVSTRGADGQSLIATDTAPAEAWHWIQREPRGKRRRNNVTHTP